MLIVITAGFVMNISIIPQVLSSAPEYFSVGTFTHFLLVGLLGVGIVATYNNVITEARNMGKKAFEDKFYDEEELARKMKDLDEEKPKHDDLPPRF
jgi:hypothetical protein